MDLRLTAYAEFVRWRSRFGELTHEQQSSFENLLMLASLLQEYSHPTLRTVKAHTQQIRILSVEDHPVFCKGLAAIIETEPDMVLVALATNEAEAITEFRRHRPDVTLLDQRLAGTNGTDILIGIRAEFPDARIIMLSSSESCGEIRRAFRSGALGYVLKSTSQEELLGVIRSVHAGKRQMPAEVAAFLAERLDEEDLTPRELQVLQLVRDGSKNKQTANQLSISENTVNFHIKNIVGKLGANDRTHAVTIAIRRGLLPLN